jgi:uncharacterized protein
MSSTPNVPAPPGRRIVTLDVLRGFALCGILLANVKPIAHRGPALGPDEVVTAGATWLHLLVDQRFFPIFALLFGAGFQLLLASAAGRADRPRLVLLRRLLALLGIGLAHHLLLWQGDILAGYATVGLLVLLPASWLPRRLMAGVAVVLIIVSVTLLGGMFTLIPGLLLLGSALVRFGVAERIERPSLVPPLLCLGLLLAAVPVTVVQQRADGALLRVAYPVAGLLLAGAYVCGLVWLMRTPARRPLVAVFAPLGRMALTNYLTATVLVLIVGVLVGESDRWSSGRVLVIAAGILALQWVGSLLWLRRFRQGPLEWRWVTWGRRPPLRRQPARERRPASEAQVVNA